MDTTLRQLTSHIIPLARSSRSVPVEIPVPQFHEPSDPTTAMNTDSDTPLCRHSATQLVPRVVNVGPDGLLLYVAEASYEPGTSPLSSWIPIVGYEPHPNYSLDLFERWVSVRKVICGGG
jgi:snurportin-1